MLHAVAAPCVLAMGVLVVLAAPTGTGRVAGASFSLAGLANFSTSAALHRGRWNPRISALVARLDHLSIFLLIAGSYTAFALLMLAGADRVLMLAASWGGAGLGIAIRLFWYGAPRWLRTGVYLALGWLIVILLPQLVSYPAHAVLALLAIGGVCYSVGGLVYGTRWPNPSRRWFGFHEIFHALAVTAFIAHYIAIFIATQVPR